MTHFFWQLVGTAFIGFCLQQEATQSAPSLAEVARAARERQQSSKPKHVLTDDDIAPGRGAPDSAAAAGNEAQTRALMEKSYPANPTVTDLKSQIEQIRIYSKYPAADLTAKFKQAAIYGYEKVDFPGRQEWEVQVETASIHFADEAPRAASRLQTILEENQDALSRHDPAASERVRAQWIDAVVRYASWQMRLQQLIDDGQSRAKAYLSNSSAAMSDYRRSRPKQAESSVAWTMIRFREMEDEFKKNTGHYTCNLADFNFNAPNPNKPYNSQYGWENKMANIRSLGYDLVMQGCDATHFTALAVPPALDGSQGRAFCTTNRLAPVLPMTAARSTASRLGLLGTASNLTRSSLRWLLGPRAIPAETLYCLAWCHFSLGRPCVGFRFEIRCES